MDGDVLGMLEHTWYHKEDTTVASGLVNCLLNVCAHNES